MRKLVLSLLLLALLLTDACTKKKPVLPPQVPAPTIAETLPDEIPETTELPPPDRVEASKKEPEPATKKPTKKTTKSAAKKTPPANTAATATPAPATAPVQTPPPQNTGQTVASLHEPPAEMTVAAAISSKDANKQKEDTARMVDSTESALKALTRQLNDEEKNMRTQIETYLQQSRKATVDGDYERAYKLAEKAQTLAAALTKQ